MTATTARVTFTRTKTFTFTADYPNYAALSDAEILAAANLPNSTLSLGELLAGSAAHNGVVGAGAWSVVSNADIEPYAMWTPNTLLTAGARVSPATPSNKLYTASAGTTGATEPAWPATIGAVVANGSVTFTCIAKF